MIFSSSLKLCGVLSPLYQSTMQLCSAPLSCRNIRCCIPISGNDIHAKEEIQTRPIENYDETHVKKEKRREMVEMRWTKHIIMAGAQQMQAVMMNRHEHAQNKTLLYIVEIGLEGVRDRGFATSAAGCLSLWSLRGIRQVGNAIALRLLVIGLLVMALVLVLVLVLLLARNSLQGGCVGFPVNTGAIRKIKLPFNDLPAVRC